MFRLAAVALLALTPTARSADPPANRLPPDECLFLLYAIEDLARDTWADPPANGVWGSATVTGFVAARSAVVGDLTQYMKARKAPDELTRAYDEYHKFLRTGTDLATKLREREAKHLAFYADLRGRLVAGEEARRADGNLAALAAASDAVRGLMDANGAIPGEQLFSGQAGNLIAARVLAAAAEDRVTAARAAEIAQARRDADEYERREGPALAADLKAIRAAFLAQTDRDALIAATAAAGKRLREVFPDLPPASDRAKDPFAAKQALVGRAVPSTDSDASEHRQLAEKCLASLALVPSGGKHDPYRPFRVQLAATAGTAATAAARQAAPGGFTAAAKFRAPNPAADLAVRAWVAFRKHDPSPVARVYAGHQEAVAHAAAGRPADAFRVISAAAREAPAYPLPDFWFDAARIATAAGRSDVARGWLIVAVRAGFRDADGARTDPDLEPVRRKLGAGFDALLAGEK